MSVFPAWICCCPVRHSRNTPAGQAQKHHFIQVGSSSLVLTMRQRLIQLPGMVATAAWISISKTAMTAVVGMRSSIHIQGRVRIRWVKRSLITGGSMTCWEMCTSMCRITGMRTTNQHRRTAMFGRVMTPARGVCSAVGPGSTARGTAVARTATGSCPASATSSLASAVPEFSREPSRQKRSVRNWRSPARRAKQAGWRQFRHAEYSRVEPWFLSTPAWECGPIPSTQHSF